LQLGQGERDMAKELGKIEKPSAEDYTKRWKLYFVPIIYSIKDSPTEYQEKAKRYWQQVEYQLSELESKLGRANRIYQMEKKDLDH